jgi:hypothetical protein
MGAGQSALPLPGSSALPKIRAAGMRNRAYQTAQQTEQARAKGVLMPLESAISMAKAAAGNSRCTMSDGNAMTLPTEKPGPRAVQFSKDGERKIRAWLAADWGLSGV